MAQNVGAGKEDHAKTAMKYGMGFGAIIGVVIAVIVFSRGDTLAALFTNDLAVISNCTIVKRLRKITARILVE